MTSLDGVGAKTRRTRDELLRIGELVEMKPRGGVAPGALKSPLPCTHVGKMVSGA